MVLTASVRLFYTEEGQLWMVPLSFSSRSSPTQEIHKVIMEGRSMEVQLDNIAADDWVKLNPGAVGFYRFVLTVGTGFKVNNSITFLYRRST